MARSPPFHRCSPSTLKAAAARWCLRPARGGVHSTLGSMRRWAQETSSLYSAAAAKARVKACPQACLARPQGGCRAALDLGEGGEGTIAIRRSAGAAATTTPNRAGVRPASGMNAKPGGDGQPTNQALLQAALLKPSRRDTPSQGTTQMSIHMGPHCARRGPATGGTRRAGWPPQS